MYNKTYQSPAAPQRIVLKPNLNYEHQDTTSSDAKTSFDRTDKHGGTYRETGRGEIDFRIQGLPHSPVQEHDHIRKQAVQKLIHQFENHPNKEALPADLKQHRAFNPLTYWPKGIVYCTCGTCLRPSDKVRKLNSDRYDVLSLPNNVIQKGPTHGRRHWNTEIKPMSEEGVHINTG